jgi:hypothetical protein
MSHFRVTVTIMLSPLLDQIVVEFVTRSWIDLSTNVSNLELCFDPSLGELVVSDIFSDVMIKSEDVSGMFVSLSLKPMAMALLLSK